RSVGRGSLAQSEKLMSGRLSEVAGRVVVESRHGRNPTWRVGAELTAGQRGGGERGEAELAADEAPRYRAEAQQCGSDHRHGRGWYSEHRQGGQGQDDRDASADDALGYPVGHAGAEIGPWGATDDEGDEDVPLHAADDHVSQGGGEDQGDSLDQVGADELAGARGGIEQQQGDHDQ